MAIASRPLVVALRSTAATLRAGAAYAWGHFGTCNCGHVAQTLLGAAPAQLHRLALEREGDWEALANAYCPTSGHAIDDVISELIATGLTTADLAHLEKLNDPDVLAALPGGFRWLARNDRTDLITYLETWASLLELELPALAA